MSIGVYVGGVELPYEVSRFPAGELGVTLGELPNVEFPYNEQEIDLGWLFQSSEEFIIMSLLLDSLRARYTGRKYTLHIPYFPSSRADRDSFFNYQLGVPQHTSFGLRVYADLLKAMNFDLIVTDDPHSNVLAGMFPSGLLTTTSLSQSVEKIITVLHESLGDLRDYNLIFVAPDSGAEKKVYECSVVATKLLKEKYDYVDEIQLLIGGKSRDVNGKIVSHTIRSASLYQPNPDLVNLIVVLDDICDGGATFVGLKELLNSSFDEDSVFVLYTTHGIYSRGVTTLTDAYDVVLTTNYLSKSDVPISVVYSYYNYTHIFKKYSEGV